jgi:hypothetical protein
MKLGDSEKSTEFERTICFIYDGYHQYFVLGCRSGSFKQEATGHPTRGNSLGSKSVRNRPGQYVVVSPVPNSSIWLWT